MGDGSIEIRTRLMVAFDGLHESVQSFETRSFVGITELGRIECRLKDRKRRIVGFERNRKGMTILPTECE